MRQFDAFPNPSVEAREIAPFLVLISSHHLRGITEVTVAPAVLASKSIAGLEIPIEIAGQTLTLVISELFSLDGQRVRGCIANLAEHEDAIRRALDRLFTGF